MGIQNESKEEIIEKEIPSKDVEKKKNTFEKQKEQYEKKKKENRKKIKIAIIIGVILLIILIFSTIFALINSNSNKIISGVSINQIDISGLSKEEAKGKLETVIADKKTKEIYLKYNDYEAEISPELIEVKYNLDEVIEEAYNVGRDSNIFVNNYNILFTLIGKKSIDIQTSLNDDELQKILEDNSSKLPNAIKEPGYYVEDDNLIITKGTKGLAINIPETKNKIAKVLNDINNNSQDYIDLEVYEKEPDEINIDEIYKEVHTEAKDAYYTKDPFQIYPEVNGVDFNVEEAKTLLQEDKEEYTIKLAITKPKVTVDQIGTEAFPDRLAVFTTRYDASNVNRTTNLRLACQKINGKVLLSGETFSYNKTLGERTIAAGYKEAKVYEAGQVVDGLGGGICQISSTLYNAALMANLEIVERRNHQFVTSYLPAGRDATVVYGAIDFQFKNTRKYPVRLIANVQNGIATVEIFGIKEEQEYEVTFDTRTVGTTPFSTKYVDDASLAEGTEVVVQKGANGLQTETYIIKSQNGKVISRKLLSKDTYTPMQKIVRRSTKTSEKTTTETKNENTVKVETKIQKEQEKQKEKEAASTTEKPVSTTKPDSPKSETTTSKPAETNEAEKQTTTETKTKTQTSTESKTKGTTNKEN